MAWSPGQDPTPEQMVQNAKRATEDKLLEVFAGGTIKALGFNQSVAQAELQRRAINKAGAKVGVWVGIAGLGLAVVQVLLAVAQCWHLFGRCSC